MSPQRVGGLTSIIAEYLEVSVDGSEINRVGDEDEHAGDSGDLQANSFICEMRRKEVGRHAEKTVSVPSNKRKNGRFLERGAAEERVLSVQMEPVEDSVEDDRVGDGDEEERPVCDL